MRPEEPQSYRDLALSLLRHPKLDMQCHCQRGAYLLTKIIKGVWPQMKFERYNQMEVVTLMDLNKVMNLINEHNLGSSSIVHYQFVDQRLIFLPKVDLRVVLQWHDRADVELHVTDPNGDTCYSFHNMSKIGGLLSVDCPHYGPEEFVLRHAIPGSYHIKAKLFHSSSNNPTGTIATVTIYIRYGYKEEAQVHSTFRLCSPKEMYNVATVNIQTTY